jgi:hypothetical protein
MIRRGSSASSSNGIGSILGIAYLLSTGAVIGWGYAIELI